MNTIKINDKEFEFRFSYKALKKFMNERKKSLNAMDDLSLEDIAYVGVIGIESAGGKITIEEMEDLLDADFAGLQTISEAMAYDMESFTKGEDGKKRKAA